MSCGEAHSQARELVAQGYAATLVSAMLVISRGDRQYDEQIVVACGEKPA